MKKRILNFITLLLLNTQFYILFLLCTFICIPIFSIIVAAQALFLSHRSTMKRFRRAIKWYGTIIIKVLPLPFVRIIYEDVDQDKSIVQCIYICNHIASSDPFLMAVLPLDLIQIVNKWPFRIPILGIFARLSGYLSVNEMSFENFSDRVSSLLAQGISIAAFPEGTRSGGKNMGQFHGAMFRIALQTRHPIVPVCITGNEKIPLKGSLLIRPGKIRIRKLKALKWDDYKKMTPFKLKNLVRNILAKEMIRMKE